MKSIMAILIAALFFTAARAQITKVELQASGLTCSMCSNAINKALKGLPFVESVNTDLNKNIFSIALKNDRAADFDAIAKKVEDAGFSVAGFWITGNFEKLPVQSETHLSTNGLNLHFMNIKAQTLGGPVRLQIIDKHFVLAKDFKKFGTYTRMPCYASGFMMDCCKPANSAAENRRIFHVTI